jgi:hypothetical protein
VLQGEEIVPAVLRTRPRMDPIYFGKPDRHQNEKLNPTPDKHQIQNQAPDLSRSSVDVEAKNGAMEVP